MSTRRWIGTAKKVKQVSTITIGGTWLATETITVTIGTVDLVVTIGSLVLTSQVAATLVQAWNGTTLTDTTATSSPSVAEGGAVSLGQFAGITASVSGSVVTLTGTAGRPFTFSVAESSASGTVADATPTAATGPNFTSNADNWSGNAVPVDNDTIVFDSGNVPVLYDLNMAIQPAAYIQTKGYSGTIGLPDINVDVSSKPYNEYRTTHLTFDNNSVTCTYTIGQGTGQGSGRTRIDAGAGQSVVLIYGTGTRLDDGIPSLRFLGIHASNVYTALGGDSAIADIPGQVSTISVLRTVASQASVPTLVVGAGVTLATANFDGGNVTVNCAGTTTTQSAGHLTWSDGAITTLVLEGGICLHFGSGAIATLKVYDAMFDRSGDNRALTVTNAIQLYKGFRFLDPTGSVTASAGYVLNCRLSDGKLDVGVGRTVTVS
jgi:hypothetical protein